ncbi:hypothetical protein SRB5_51590 [Streptomyces sp. RB5]|uniref:DUF4326 domain-containing protein n=1 Tax=Streptomyces smaragdinus TaxID=2585196 RepID=A0A7K0CPN5_9ACTN|nr:DUF4326 domain-containing protein [Streptomyces smaragdinus]MQY14982.1 hypothetical protein [Streptomyces smaragdinus]
MRATDRPRRLQRCRTKGWRAPAGAVYVGRGSLWGNPFRVGDTTPDDWHEPFAGVLVRDRAHAVELLRAYLAWRAGQPSGWCSRRGPNFQWERAVRAALHGRDLMCWCPADQPCHADLLLELANPTTD